MTAADGGMLQPDAAWTGTTTIGAAMGQMEMQLTGASHVRFTPGQVATAATSSGTGSASMTMAGANLPMKITSEVTATQIP